MRQKYGNPGAVQAAAGVRDLVLTAKLDARKDSPRRARLQDLPVPFRSIGELAAEIAAHMAFREKVRRLHHRGPRLVAELLAHIAADRTLGTYVDELIDRFVGVPDEALDLASGRDLPPAPLTAIKGGRK